MAFKCYVGVLKNSPVCHKFIANGASGFMKPNKWGLWIPSLINNSIRVSWGGRVNCIRVADLKKVDSYNCMGCSVLILIWAARTKSSLPLISPSTRANFHCILGFSSSTIMSPTLITSLLWPETLFKFPQGYQIFSLPAVKWTEFAHAYITLILYHVHHMTQLEH